jgi:hypothetical protein
MPRKILPYNRDGIWKTDFPLYVDEAIDLMEEYNANIQQLIMLKQRIPNDAQDRELYYYETIDPQHSKVYMSYVKLVLICCMTVEAFLNLYGVRRLGDKYYNDNLERLNPIKKINVIMAICFQEVYRDRNDVIENIRNIFSVRNSFVHPTTKEYSLEDVHKKPELFTPTLCTPEAGNNIIKYLRMFFEWFKNHDSEVDLEYEIKILNGDT